MIERYIAHVDMDAFFAAVEQRDNPSFRGKPVIVGADPKKGKGRGVVSTCSYEARKFGLHSAMPISEAWRRCPKGIFVSPNIKKYSAVSKIILKIFYDFTPDMEPISIDEAFLDITRSYKLFGKPMDVCRLIKERIKTETGLIASVGLAPNKFIAKIASDLEKPDGLVVVKPKDAQSFLRPLDISRIWGLGPKTENILKGRGISTIGQLAVMDSDRLFKILGRQGAEFKELALGIDNREVKTEAGSKSISNEITFESDTDNEDKIKASLLALSDKVSFRLRKEGLKGKTITLKIRLEDFSTFSRSISIAFATNYADIIYGHIMKLYNSFKKGNKKTRLLGAKVTNFIAAEIKESLFDEAENEKREKAHKAIDDIRKKFGDKAIYRAGTKKN
jgi:DNA polymerase IV